MTRVYIYLPRILCLILSVMVRVKSPVSEESYCFPLNSSFKMVSMIDLTVLGRNLILNREFIIDYLKWKLLKHYLISSGGLIWYVFATFSSTSGILTWKWLILFTLIVLSPWLPPIRFCLFNSPNFSSVAAITDISYRVKIQSPILEIASFFGVAQDLKHCVVIDQPKKNRYLIFSNLKS